MAVYALEGVRLTFKVGLKIAETVVKVTLGGILDIKEVSFGARLAAAQSGHVRGRVVLVLLGHTQVLNMDITLHAISGMVPALVDAAKSAIDIF